MSRPLARPSFLFSPFLLGALLLAACGGGGGGGGGTAAVATPATSTAGPVLNGQFVDAPVANLHWSAAPSGLSGDTDSNGGFHFTAGDTVSFSFDGQALGSAAPAANASGSIVVTPFSLTGEADPANAPKATALVLLLNSLDSISVAQGQGHNGGLVLPLAGFSGYSTENTQLAAQLASLGSLTGVTSSALTSLLGTIYGSTSYFSSIVVQNETVAQALVLQTQAVAPLVGTIWRGSVVTGSSSTPWTLYFAADYAPNGLFYSFTGGGTALHGAWSLQSNGSIQISTYGPGTASSSATLQPTDTSLAGTGVDASGNAITFTATKVTASAPIVNSYTGLWFATLTPATGGAAALVTAKILVDATGALSAYLSDGSVLNGSVALATGKASASSSAASTLAFNLDFAAGTGTATNAGVLQSSLALSRSGTL